MRKSFLLIYDDRAGSRDAVKAMLDSIPQILNWRYDTIPNVFYLVSESDAFALSDLIKAKLSQECSFLVCEVTNAKQGYLIPNTWKILNEKNLPGG